jgi:hypothetical protein
MMDKDSAANYYSSRVSYRWEQQRYGKADAVLIAGVSAGSWQRVGL